MRMNSLTSKEKAELRGLAQSLRPAIHIGRNGLAEGTVLELRKVFEREELVKVAFKADREEMPGLVSEVERITGSECVGGAGKRRAFYRRLPAKVATDEERVSRPL